MADGRIELKKKRKYKLENIQMKNKLNYGFFIYWANEARKNFAKCISVAAKESFQETLPITFDSKI